MNDVTCPQGHRPDRCPCGKPKGSFGGPCNRKVCNSRATWYNKVMQSHYCAPCARLLNHWPLPDGSVLCTNAEPRQEG